MKAMENGTSFAEAAKGDPGITGVVPAEELGNICTMDNHLRNEEYILARLGLH